MMGFAVGDIFAEFKGEPHSPGVTSLLQLCMGSDDRCDEITSDALTCSLDFPVNEPQPQTGNIHLPLPNELKAGSLQHTVLQPANMQSKSLALGDLASSVVHDGLLGTETQTRVSIRCDDANTIMVARKRGRKPKPRLPDLQKRLDILNEQFKQLSKENNFLRNKLKVLERVVPYRDESVGFLVQLFSKASHAPRREAAAIQPNSSRDASELTNPPRFLGGREQSPTTSGEATDSHDTPLWSGLSAAIAGSAGETQSFHARDGRSGGSGGRVSCTSSPSAAGRAEAAMDIIGVGHMDSTSSQQQQRQHWEQDRERPWKAGNRAVLALCPAPDGEVPTITLGALEELKQITPGDFRLLWKQICLQLGVLVTGAEVHGPGSSPFVRLERFLERALTYMDKITLLSPACFVHSMYTNVETGQSERPSDSFWITCARALQLSPQQLSEVNSLAAVYEQNVVPMVQQRLQLAMQLTTRLASATGDRQRGGSGGDALTVLSSVDELAEQLERNVLKEHQTHWNIGDFLCSSVLTPLQVAKALTITYPYIPDGVAMLHAFKIISGLEDGRAAARPQTKAAATTANASMDQPRSNQLSPSLAGLLAGQLPVLAMGRAAGGCQTQARRGHVGLHQQSGGTTGAMAAILAKAATSLSPTQKQPALAAVLQQPAQVLKTMASGLQQHPQAKLFHVLAASLQQQAQQQQQQQQQQQSCQMQPLLAGVQSAAAVLTGSTRNQLGPGASAVAAASSTPGSGLPAGAGATTGQLQSYAALLGALATGRQTSSMAQSGALPCVGTLSGFQ